MRLEEQVCTLDQSRKLRKLGIESESNFNWAFNGKEARLIWGNTDEYGARYTYWVKLPAYSVAELGDLLPDKAKALTGEINIIGSHKFDGEYNCFWQHQYNIIAPTEAQARAAMLIHLIENGIVQPSKTPEA